MSYIKYLVLLPTFLMFSGILFASKLVEKAPDWENLKLDNYLKMQDVSMELKTLKGSGKDKKQYYIVSKKLANGKTELMSQLFDFDGDGKIDLAKHFEAGKLSRSEWNLDRDDKVEVVKYHKAEDESVHKKVETDGDMNIWSYYFKGNLRRKEFDRNKDSVIDMWYYYKGGKLTKAMAAKDFDPKKLEDITKKITK